MTPQQDSARAYDAVRARMSDGQLRDGYGEGALVLTTPEGATTCGSADPTSGVTADRFELFRAMTGRRSPEQVASWDWTGEPAVERLCLLPARPTPLVE